MTEAKHTPRPWLIRQGDEWTKDIVTVEGYSSSGEQMYWNVASCNKQRHECDANMRLIAAAPELLVACKSVIAAHAEWIESMTGLRIAGESSCIQICRTAIAKATGEQA